MKRWSSVLLLSLLACTAANALESTKVQVYGFAMLDMGYQAKQADPAWFDVLRPTKLPSFEDEFGEDGHWFAGVRQSRFGAKSFTPTDLGELRTTFEFEMFGTGVDAGQTTIRLRHAYGELNQFGAGQTWSPFMDIDIFPNSVEYWGPNGMVFFRNVQARWMPIQGDTRCTIAHERPGASGDLGDYADRIALEGDVMPRFPAPDLSAEYRAGREWGYVEAAGIVRWMEWDDVDTTDPDLSGDAVGWGVNLTSNIKTGERGTARLGVVYGEGIQNYMNDAPEDVGVEVDSDGSLEGVALPMLGISAFMDMQWNERWSSAFGYSMLDIDNSNGQSANAFHRGHYALINLMHYPAPNVMLGPELQWGKRENNSDDFTSDDFRIQFSAKYNFSTTIGGGES
jgi:hypothetical protein